LDRVFIVHPHGELETGERHGGGGLLERRKGAVEVERHVVGCSRDGITPESIVFGEFEEKFLRLSVAEIEAGGFEHEALEADDGLSGGLKELGELISRDSGRM
jgi:hypothetical protein